LKREDLELVWSEEGDSVFLLEQNRFLAAVPGWAWSAEFKKNGFAGYARDCSQESRLCWPLVGEGLKNLEDDLIQFRECWHSWDSNPWPGYQAAILGACTSMFGKESKYFGIDGGEWPPRFLARFDVGDKTVFLTGGMSLRPMPRVDSYTNEPGRLRRVELGMAISRDFKIDEGAVAGALSGIAEFPWRNYTWLGEGHTTGWQGFGKSSPFSAGLLSRSLPNAPKLSLPDFRGDPVTVLWITPITSNERELAQKKGSAELLKRLIAAGVDCTFSARRFVV
jgi:hypothetical protein